VLCCAVLCCAVLCCAVLCCAVLCCWACVCPCRRALSYLLTDPLAKSHRVDGIHLAIALYFTTVGQSTTALPVWQLAGLFAIVPGGCFMRIWRLSACAAPDRDEIPLRQVLGRAGGPH